MIETPLTRQEGDQQALTDVEFWNAFWKDYAPGPFPPACERQYGSEGYFLRMMDSLGIQRGQSVIELGGRYPSGFSHSRKGDPCERPRWIMRPQP